MRRRELLALAGGAAAWSVTAHADEAPLPVIGFLHSGTADQYVTRLAPYWQGLKDGGFVEGQNVRIEFRWAEGHLDRLPALAAELVQRHVDVIAAPASTPAAIDAKAATTVIPIVFMIGSDPVALGLIASLSRPGGNATGITAMNADLAAKKLGVMRALIPKAERFFTLVNPQDPLTEPFISDLQAGAATLGIHIDVLRANDRHQLEVAFGDVPQEPGNVLVMATDVFFYQHRGAIAALAAQHRLPTIYDNREYTEAGGLISYGADVADALRQAGAYTARVLKGEKPADLPVLQESKFELAINLKAATALGLEVPPTLLATADEVIE